ncbi:MAG: helix-turn-helix transcriptional regulator [Planctomycetes bacterium]|nr:helix-turn-helix transcriptional regulator [Planctomycetota bacterium]
MAQVHSRTLFHSPLVSVRDVCCRPASSACSGEEYSSGNQLVFPRAGLFVQHLPRTQVVADPNHVLFFNADVPYRVSHPVPGGDDCTVFDFAPDVLREALSRYDPSVRDRPHTPFPHTHGPSAPRVVLLQQLLRRRLHFGNDDALAAEEIALEMLDRVAADAHCVRGLKPARFRHATEQAHRSLVQATQAVLGERFRTPLSLTAIARAVHSSPFHLARVFRRHVEIPIHRYLHRLRLRAALECLADGAGDFTQLALDVGFASHSHFTEAFRREFDIAPSHFRRVM